MAARHGGFVSPSREIAVIAGSRRGHRTPVWLLEVEEDSRLALPNALINFVEEVCLSGEAADQEARAELEAGLIDAVAKT